MFIVIFIFNLVMKLDVTIFVITNADLITNFTSSSNNRPQMFVEFEVQ